MSFVYNDGDTDEEDDVLGYYKSWNQIIGGDLTAFHPTSGEYVLSRKQILFPFMEIDRLGYDHLCAKGANFKVRCHSYVLPFM